MIPGIRLIDTLTRPRGPVQATRTALSISSLNESVYTFNNQPLGSEPDFNQERIIVVGTGGHSGFSGTASISVTVGGVSAVKIANGDIVFDLASLWVVRLQTGTIATITVTFSNTMARAYCVAYSVVGVDGLAPASAVTDTLLSGNDLNASINCPAGGVIIGTSFIRSFSDASPSRTTWTNLRADVDGNVETARNNFSAAHDEFPTQQTNRSITATGTGGGTRLAGRLSLASWGPA